MARIVVSLAVSVVRLFWVVVSLTSETRPGPRRVIPGGPGEGRHDASGAGRPRPSGRFLSDRGDAYTQPPCRPTPGWTVATCRFSSVGQSDSLVMNRSSVRFRQAAQRNTTGQAPFSPESGAFPLPEACSDAP